VIALTARGDQGESSPAGGAKLDLKRRQLFAQAGAGGRRRPGRWELSPPTAKAAVFKERGWAPIRLFGGNNPAQVLFGELQALKSYAWALGRRGHCARSHGVCETQRTFEGFEVWDRARFVFRHTGSAQTLVTDPPQPATGPPSPAAQLIDDRGSQHVPS
jgi:hypothetical protein